MNIEWTIEFGDILTTMTILISVTALIISWSNDRRSREAALADKVRAAAAHALTKFDRWQSLNLSLYDELQPIFIEVSEALEKDFNIMKARDRIWKEIYLVRARISSKILDEQIGTSYIDLLSHFPKLRIVFHTLFEQLTKLENRISEELLLSAQEKILQLDGHEEKYASAILGNALRDTANDFRERLKTGAQESIVPLKRILINIMVSPNQLVLKGDRSEDDS